MRDFAFITYYISIKLRFDYVIVYIFIGSILKSHTKLSFCYSKSRSYFIFYIIRNNVEKVTIDGKLCFYNS